MPSSTEETLINLLDSYWFEYGVFTFKPPPYTPNTTPILDKKQEHPKLNKITTLMKKSSSDQFLSSKSNTSFSDSSPKSVLQTILSDKEIKTSPNLPAPKKEENNLNRQKIRQIHERRKKSSKSMSELEFEELKGFMDLGFVFSGEVKDSKLVSIIPGLQRLGKNYVENLESVSRPYLSEAWEYLEIEEKKSLMNWGIADFGNEMELKDHLRIWAHNVASTVRC